MRTHYCGELDSSVAGEEVELTGWVHRRRDHGGVIFLDVRDRTGIVQVVYDPDTEESFAVADKVRNEFVLLVHGVVRPRPDGTVNADMKTGEIEVLGSTLEILNASATPPFQLDEHSSAGEDVKLRYRYIYLRRPEMQQRLRMRAAITSFVRRFLETEGFWDVETPTLTKTTPEGARDYLVPSRTHPGEFFALPQSPQIFKQLLMVSGFDKYYQIARCYRDEDLRHDRQPEFTQIDIEASFVEEADVMALTERMLRTLFIDMLEIDLGEFPVLAHADAMRLYGSDRPDLRNPLVLTDIDDLMTTVEFKVFNGPANDPKGRVVALKAAGAADTLSRKQLDDYASYVGNYGAKGLAYIKVNDREQGMDGLQSPILKFLTEDVIEKVLERVDAATGDIIFFGSDKRRVVNESMGAFRNRVAADLGLIEDGFSSMLGSRLADVRGDPRRYAGAGAPSFHAAGVHTAGAPFGPGKCWRTCVRRGVERQRVGRRIDSDSRCGYAERGIRGAAHGTGGTDQIRLFDRRPEAWLPAARRDRLGARPPCHVDDGHRSNPRCDRVPEDAERQLHVDSCAEHRGRSSAAGVEATHPRRLIFGV